MLVLHLQGLQHGQAVGKGVLLDGRGTQHGGVATDGFVGLRDDSHYVITVLNKSLERANGKLGCSHEHYAEVFLFHCVLVLFILSRTKPSWAFLSPPRRGGLGGAFYFFYS